MNKNEYRDFKSEMQICLYGLLQEDMKSSDTEEPMKMK